MPLTQRTKDGQEGWKWGDNGVCHIGPDARARAEDQGKAIDANKADSMTEYRQDAGGSVSTRLDANGYLRVDGIVAKAGVLTYVMPSGEIRREYVPAETLFNADSIATLMGAPVTIEHPNGLVTPDNASSLTKGSVSGTPVADGSSLKALLVVTNADAIASVSGGKQQLSPGYKVELDFTPGEYEGQKYDAVQVSRVYNHLAIVSSARGGSECRLNLDGLNCAVEVVQSTTDEVKPMPSVKLHSGATVEVADASTASAIQAEINQLGQRADAADKMIDQAKYDELQGKYDALMTEMEKLKSAKEEKMDSDQIGEFLAVVDSAKKLKADVEIKADGKYLDATGVMAAALGIDATGKSAEYVKGRFDSAVELLNSDSVRKQREVKVDSSERVLTGREKFMAEQLKRGA